MSPTARFLLYAQKKPGKENGSREEGFLPDALPLHPYLLTLQTVRPHIWAGCIRPPPLPIAVSAAPSAALPHSLLALPLGELSPQVTERAAPLEMARASLSWPSGAVCAVRRLGDTMAVR